MLLTLAANKGINLRIVQALRSLDEQNALYVQGRQDLTVVNDFRRKVKWPDILKYENRKVTNAKPGESWHNFGRAFDVVPMENKVPNWEYKDWESIGDLGESCGLEWGGRWSTPDRPHFQFTNGLTLKQAREMMIDGGS